MSEVECYFEQKTIPCGEYANLRKVLMLNGISPYDDLRKFSNCLGNGICGTCAVEVLEGMENLTPPTPAEEGELYAKGCPRTFRLTCQAQMLKGKVTVITHPKIR